MTTLTRREFLAASAAAGYALAVRPISAETIMTDTQGLEVGAVQIPVTGRTIPGYRAQPTGNGPFPVVLVVHEIFGVHEYIRDVCRRLAKQGYLAVAPDLYARQGDATKLADINDIVTKVVAKVPDAQVMGDLDATVTWAKSNKGDTARLGITGFCWGGRITWLYCAHNAHVKAGVAWYGRLAGQSSELQPKYPLDVASTLTLPVLGLYGGEDQGIPLDTVERMRNALKAAGNPSEIVVYPGAAHGFHADYRPSYKQDAAEDGWQRLLAWFRRHGVARAPKG
jgi:carboxymethylenebutenolidase